MAGKNHQMVPKKFTLHGTEWSIEYAEDVTNGQNLGRCSSPESLITLQKKHSGIDIAKTQIEATFFHELIHAFLDSGEYHELSQDEHLVAHLGNCLHQFMKSKQ